MKTIVTSRAFNKSDAVGDRIYLGNGTKPLFIVKAVNEDGEAVLKTYRWYHAFRDWLRKLN